MYAEPPEKPLSPRADRNTLRGSGNPRNLHEPRPRALRASLRSRGPYLSRSSEPDGTLPAAGELFASSVTSSGERQPNFIDEAVNGRLGDEDLEGSR